MEKATIGRRKFGPIEAAEDVVLDFERGLFGFENVGRYMLRRVRKGSPLRVLRAIPGPDLAFAVLDPLLLDPSYEVELSGEDQEALRWKGESNLAVIVIVSDLSDPARMSANMKGPIVIDAGSRLGRQVLQTGDRYSARFRIADAVGRGPGQSPKEA